MARSDEAFNGEWEDTEGNQITINGKSVLGPAGIELDIAFESDNTCLMQMGEEYYEGCLGDDGCCIEWSDGEIWKRKFQNQDTKYEARHESDDSLAGEDKKPRSGALTLEEALAIQKDLRKGFSSAAFQDRLVNLSRKYPDGSPQYLSARSDLFLEVQSKILPSYGFAGTHQGVVEMLRAAACWNGNRQFCKNRNEINQLLGLSLHLDENQKRKKLTSSGTILRNPRADIGSAQKPLLLPSSLQLNLPAARLQSQTPNGEVKAKCVDERDNDNNPTENFGIVEMPQRTHQHAAQNVEIRAHEALGDLEITVTLPETATFGELKEAISLHVGRPDIMKHGHLVQHINGTYLPFKNTDRVGCVREVLVLRASLVVQSDHEAQAWRQTLEHDIHERRIKFEDRLLAARRRQDELAQCAIDVATQGKDVAPHGKCYLVGTWDDCTERHEMMWDGVSYRIGMNLQGTTEISFQIIAHDSRDARIYPSRDNAGPDVPHTVLGPAQKDFHYFWTVHVDDGSAADDKAYEIVLHCPVGRPMSLVWHRVSLDAISWYPTLDSE